MLDIGSKRILAQQDSADVFLDKDKAQSFEAILNVSLARWKKPNEVIF
jgi:hypothetical protein